MLYTVIFMFAGLAFASLSVDWGRVELAKTQLKAAADSAARASVAQVGNITAVQNTAYTYAGYNFCDGSQIQIDTVNDVQFLDWDTTTRTYTVLTGTARNAADAIRVTCKRTGTSGIPLTFAKFAGYATKDVQASSIASIVPPGFGLVGLNYITLKGNATASYWSGSGTVGGNAGNIASNGNISSSSPANVYGTVWHMPGTTVTGITANYIKLLPSLLVYANGSSGSYTRTNNDNGLITPSGVVNSTPDFNAGAGKTVTMPAGNYVFHNFSLAANATLNITGPATIYYYGTFSMGGNTTTAANLPRNLKVVAVPNATGGAPGQLTISSGGAVYGNIYAPQSDITLSGLGSIYGQIIGKSITASGSADLYYDLNLNGANGVIQVVH